MNNKQVMAQVVEVVKEKYNVMVKANLRGDYNEVYIKISVANIPESQQKVIQKWANTQGFVLETIVDTYITPSYQERIDAKCAEAGAMLVPARDTQTGKLFNKYNNTDQRQAMEAIWEEDQTGVRIAFIPEFMAIESVQYA
ncbi:hypothetical protein SAMN04487895_10348 [Paenibacillus sophorae]|uniref:Uncharacterized protein n=1 Tax=Paenibacillus sophorae TaxID=1333845 RepID=A0A1H8JJD3_9BACL|nr:hypothetical protein [Paenibacillus sophorae]QWU13383.1 hypothetical protein KP014_15390 [Paenibacillus sophorae]SEN80869.1 hypothetical protein SAMN04487895_10348 [Paenibacillus sophorae]